MADNKQTWTFFVAGVQHHDLADCIHRLSVGDKLTLVPEPTNKYDANAVRIHFDDEELEIITMLGYVPGKISSEVTAEMTIYDNVECVITQLIPSNKPWKRLEVIVGRELDTSKDEAEEELDELDFEEE